MVGAAAGAPEDGTGIGGGVVLDDELMWARSGGRRDRPPARRTGWAGVWLRQPRLLGDLRVGSALVRQAKDRLRAGSLLGRDLLDCASGDVEAVTDPKITDAAREGDAFAIEQLAELGRWLGERIASLVALDPAIVAIGGGVSEAGDLLLDPIRDAFGAQLTERGYRTVAQIRLAELGDRAGQLGAADLGRRH